MFGKPLSERADYRELLNAISLCDKSVIECMKNYDTVDEGKKHSHKIIHILPKTDCQKVSIEFASPFVSREVSKN